MNDKSFFGNLTIGAVIGVLPVKVPALRWVAALTAVIFGVIWFMAAFVNDKPEPTGSAGISVISKVSRIARAGVSARRALHLAAQQDSPSDLIDHAGAAAQLIQPLLGQPSRP